MVARTLKILAAGALAAALSAGTAAAADTVKVGVTGGPHAEIMEKVAEVAAKDGLTVEIIEFSDYVLPNTALNDGDLAANSFQHQPYLDNQIRDRGYEIATVAKTVVFPMGLYSKKIDDLAKLEDGATVAIPNDPTNGGRALLLLESAGLIDVDDAAGLKATPLDVVKNDKNLKFQELDAAQLPRSLDDVGVAAVNTNYAMSAGLDPKKDSIFIEKPESPYVNIVAVRTADKDAPWVATLVKAYHSEAVKQFIDQRFGKSVVTSW
ncbi:MetQ/NlpA family ABC transporter substrate-binding protein [Caenispirillum bisanense]|uniref:D-methionine transport system substrate-binding protein n=1 Tax=Caenispirillum bisanense TaxID=414052 RepID=A0A286GKM6_9PROT|nr:MetQ/NlpA family ABC transporter substrate-binding protein [Caenispirillum bisanense]SOD96088.1 D-methionine transport system substrate-binding protein [Caenispirillum bisanense]